MINEIASVQNSITLRRAATCYPDAPEWLLLVIALGWPCLHAADDEADKRTFLEAKPGPWSKGN